MNELIAMMKTGTAKQQCAWKTIDSLGILKDMIEYHPTVCGTIPIGIDTHESDIDIIMEVNDFKQFWIRLEELYSLKKDFTLKEISIRGNRVVKANFYGSGF
ncbi:DUF4269 domain-containing protein [Bacillus salacetis]|uniref:DUF4269 domain-containing protein n=1 Tax=Bacillus salacetis TaxID=2315464 RepID=UPI0023E79943|nr:DUF4269 domain-containing protein [Bacillus salacetis]